MKDKPRGEEGQPYGAGGRLWKDYGRAALRNILKGPVGDDDLAAIWQSLDKSLVLPIDLDDNGIAKMGKLSLADIVSACGPAWDTAELYGAQEARARETLGFANAASTVAAHLLNMADRVRASFKAANRVLEAYEQAQDKRTLLMETGMPTEKVIFEHALPVVYVVSPARTGRWIV